MNILALSLLRIGDLFMHQLLFHSIKKKYPHAKLHVLVNDVSASALNVIENVDQFHVFQRHRIQKILVEENRPVQNAVEEIEEFIQHLRSHQFDQIYNLTHTQFSARLIDLLVDQSLTQVVGVHYREHRKAPISQPWLAYLNDKFSLPMPSQFHYISLLAKAMDLEVPELLPVKNRGVLKRIFIQPLTSDKKKNWQIKNYVQVTEALLNDKYKVTLIGSADDALEIRKAFGHLHGVNYSFSNWLDLRHELGQADLLICGDTSVMHFAALCGTRVLPIFLGSADASKTAPFQEDRSLLVAQAPCYPCRHSVHCDKQTHLCGESISVNQVLSMVKTTEKSGSIQQGGDIMNLKAAIEQFTWQIYLDGDHRLALGPYGSSSRNIFSVIEKLQIPHALAQNWIQSKLESVETDLIFLEEFEQRAIRSASLFHQNEVGYRMSKKELKEVLTNYLLSKKENTDYFMQLKTNIQSDLPLFPYLKSLRSALLETRSLLSIEERLLKSLKTELNERKTSYVSGVRKLSEAGIAKA